MKITPAAIGILATLVAFATLRLTAIALFTSGFALILAAVIAHGIGTATATLIEGVSLRETITALLRRLAITVLFAIVMWQGSFFVLRTMIQWWRQLYAQYPLAVTTSSPVIMLAACALVSYRLRWHWHRYAWLMAVPVYAYVLFYLSTIP